MARADLQLQAADRLFSFGIDRGERPGCARKDATAAGR
jgi:hypothetical protein